jgi:phosphate transport system substrate-binding protein
MRKHLMVSMILTLLVGSAVMGCNPASVAGEPGSDLQGTITISGAWALYPLVVRWSEEFTKLHPEVHFDISAGGAGKGMADALSGVVDLGMVSRAIYPEEEAKGAFWLPVARDAVFVTISAENPVLDALQQTGVNREEMASVFMTGEIVNWGQLVGRPEVDAPIHVFTRSDACGAAATWAEYLGGTQEDLLGVGVYGDPGLLDAVIRDPLGIGYNNLNYAFDFETGKPVAGAQVVALDGNGDGVLDPGERCESKEQAVAAVAGNIYPAPPARDLNLVAGSKPDGLVLAFLRWALTDGQAFVDEVGYIALSPESLDGALNELE